MAPTDRSLPARIILQIICIAVAFLGARVLWDLKNTSFNLVDQNGFNWFALPFVLIETGFGALCIFVAWRVWFRQSARSIRWLFFLAILGAFHLSFPLVDDICIRITGHPFVPAPDVHSNLRDSIVRAGLELLPLIAAMLLYRVSVRWVFAALNLSDDRSAAQRLQSIKTSLAVIAFFIISSGSEISDQVLARPGHQNRGPYFSDQLGVFAPFVLAILVYKLGARIAARRMHNSAMPGATEASR